MPTKSLTTSRQQSGLALSFAMAAVLLFVIFFHSQLKATEQGVAYSTENLQLSLTNLSQKIDARIASMRLIAKTIANDTHIHYWVDNGFAAQQESLLVDKLGFLVEEYGLTSASFADKNTHKYWNHEGFLRVLKPEVDTWYFAYLASKETDLISVYHDKNKHRVDVYVNYQQPNGRGLSGIATSFDGVVEQLNISILAEQGEVYLVDSSGQIQVQANAAVAADKRLQEQVPQAMVDTLLQSNFSPFMQVKNRLIAASYIPSMNWYLVAVMPKK